MPIIYGNTNIEGNLETNGITSSTLKLTNGAQVGYFLKSDILGNANWEQNVTSLTYDDFYTEITSDNLIPGTFYEINDFRTIYDQPDFDSGFNPQSITKYGSTSSIVVYATSNSSISEDAHQPKGPFGNNTLLGDRIKYDWRFNETEFNNTPARGRISERIDTNNNRTDYDHRVVVFKRYLNDTIYNSIFDNGQVFGEFRTFNTFFIRSGGITFISLDSSTNNYIGDFFKWSKVNNYPFILPNNVFGILSYIDAPSPFDNRVFYPCYNNRFDFCYNNTISSLTANNTVNLMTGNTIVGTFINNNVNLMSGNGSTSSIVNFDNNNISDIQDNLIFGTFSNNEIKILDDSYIGEFTYNRIDDTISGVTFSTTQSFTRNSVKISILDVDLSASTLIYQDYNKDIFRNSVGNIRLSYIDGSGSLTVTNYNS
jgi:hypothetical protein